MMLATLMLTQPAPACGGFFCNGVTPVVQTGERILFREDAPGEWTSFIEIQYQGQPSDFAWVVPIPQVIDPETEVDVAPAGLFDALEEATAPRFVRSMPAADSIAMEAGAACSSGCGPSQFGSFGSVARDTSGVEVVGEAVAGPYAVEVITAEEGANLANWLQLNGYQIPYAAWEPMDAYIEQGYAFLGLKLQPDTPEGPIDTLVLQCGSDRPTIPLMLTAIAASADMPITVYTLSDSRHRPSGDWPELDFDHGQVAWLSDGITNYDELLLDATRTQRGAFLTEYAQPSEVFAQQIAPETLTELGHGTYLTRMRSFVSPEDMLSDPVFVADPEATPVDNLHYVDAYAMGAMGSLGAVWVLGLTAFGVGRRRGDAVTTPRR